MPNLEEEGESPSSEGTLGTPAKASFEESDEPKLKYHRFCPDIVEDIRSRGDAVLSCVAHAKFVLLGTRLGQEIFLDSEGNQVRRRDTPERLPVKCLSLDSVGEFLLSLSAKGLSLSTLMDFDEATRIEVPKQAQESAFAIAIDPIFNKSGRRFMLSSQNSLSLHEKGLFNSYRPQVLCTSNEGPFYSLSWGGLFAAWCSRKGLRVYDVIAKETISIIKPPLHYPRQEIPTRINWISQSYFLVCQGSAMRICRVQESSNDFSMLNKPSVSKSTLVLPGHYVELSHTFIFEEHWLLGAAPLEDNLFVILALSKTPEEDDNSHDPLLFIIEPISGNEYNLISRDVLSFKDAKDFRPKDYSLQYFSDNYLITGPNDLIAAEPRDQDDHIDFLLESEDFEEALTHAEENEKFLSRHTPKEIGDIFFEHLFKHEFYAQAGRLCPRILGRNGSLWEAMVEKFSQVGQTVHLAPHLPKDPRSSSRMKPQVYEHVLGEFLNNGQEKFFLEFVKDWPPELYNVSTIAYSVVNKILVSPDDGVLHEALATLFTYQKKYDKALAVYLKYGHPEVFQLIESHGLIHMVADKIENLLELNYKKALSLFLENMDALPPEMIVRKIGYNSYLLEYLDAIKDNPLSWDFHGDLVLLYADFAPGKLLHFLRNSDHYPIQKALEVCESRCLTSERVYILARMGNSSLALKLIINELSDIHRGVAFCKENDDPELWKDLIHLSLDKPYFINVLLHNIGTHVDPRILISKISNGQQIPGLRDSLVQIMWDYRLQVSLQEGCKRILNSDCFSLFSRSHKTRTRGLALSSDALCGLCGLQLLKGATGGSSSEEEDIVMFMCHHSFHLDCISNKMACCLCRSTT